MTLQVLAVSCGNVPQKLWNLRGSTEMMRFIFQQPVRLKIDQVELDLGWVGESLSG